MDSFFGVSLSIIERILSLHRPLEMLLKDFYSRLGEKIEGGGGVVEVVETKASGFLAISF